MGWGQYLFGFRGRLNRTPYWKSILVGIAFLPIGVILIVPYMTIERPDLSEPNHALSLLGMATIAAEGLLVLAYFVFVFAVMVKRLHDRDKSAWWILPFFAIPELLGLIIDPKLQPFAMPLHLRLALDFVVLGLSLWAFVELGFVRGTIGDNRYGPDPLARRA